MRFSTLMAFALGAIVLVASMLTSAKNPWIYINGHAALVVFGGTLSAAAISFGFHRLYTLMRVLARRLVSAQSHFEPRQLIEEIMHISEIYRNRPEQLAMAVEALQIRDPFLREIIDLVAANYLSEEDLSRIMMTRTSSIYQRYFDDAVKFKALAKFPPAFGLMGAVMGMVGTMSEMGSKGADAGVGTSLALALVGTLYGVALANLVILPLAENLQDAAREVKAKNLMISEAVHLMMQKKNPILMAEDLNSFVLASERLDWKIARTKKSGAA